MKICYTPKKFKPETLEVIWQAESIVRTYTAQGFCLTLRQLFYQFVSRSLLPNTQRDYHRLGLIVNDARLAGLIDWNAIEDRTREVRELPTWDSPADIVSTCASQFRIDKWEKQPRRVEVWIEKDALIGVIEDACDALQVPYFSCHGYVSQSSCWRAAQRLLRHIRKGQRVHILHLSDHDPSGLDMTADLRNRMDVFNVAVEITRIALDMDQVAQYNLPPNPTKLSDSRSHAYIAEHGPNSWELDALEPAVISDLISDEIAQLQEETEWKDACTREKEHKKHLRAVSDRWEDISRFVGRGRSSK